VSSGVWAWLGRVPFGPTAALQDALRVAVAAGRTPETLLLCEHDPVISLGRSARPEHVLASPEELAQRGIERHQASRGGDVTYHGPGQLVGYPIFRVRRGVVAHVEGMARAIIAVLATFHIAGEWRRQTPGVWVGDKKICAFGVHVRSGVSIHGFALNLRNRSDGFDAIVPCGLKETGVTSVIELRADSPEPAAVAPAVAESFARVFGLDLARRTPEELSEFLDLGSASALLSQKSDR
jgi:lipoyl(octanoyl) transferase